jgi:hypothetical protein
MVLEKNVRKSFHNDGRTAATRPTLSLSIADTSEFSHNAQKWLCRRVGHRRAVSDRHGGGSLKAARSAQTVSRKWA